MEDFAATIRWMYASSGIDGVVAPAAEWLASVDWTPLVVLLALAAACYVAYVLLDESI